MKSVFAALVVLSSVSVAHADGYRCQTVEQDLNVKIYNHTDAAAGTRNAAIMVLSDPSVQGGRKTIASFTSVKKTLAQTGATYVAKVDLRVSESSRGGENVAGTKLEQLKNVVVDVDFTYARPVADGAELAGTVTFIKRNGEESRQELSCFRYLKGDQ